MASGSKRIDQAYADIEWYHTTSPSAMGYKAQSYGREGGSFSMPLDHTPPDRIIDAARRHRRIHAALAPLATEHRDTLAAAFSTAPCPHWLASALKYRTTHLAHVACQSRAVLASMRTDKGKAYETPLMYMTRCAYLQKKDVIATIMREATAAVGRALEAYSCVKESLDASRGKNYKAGCKAVAKRWEAA